MHHGDVRVLVVEDNDVVADAIAEGLPDHGMAVDVAYDGGTGLENAELTVARWGRGGAPRNVLIRRGDGRLVVRPFRGLRQPAEILDRSCRSEPGSAVG